MKQRRKKKEEENHYITILITLFPYERDRKIQEKGKKVYMNRNSLDKQCISNNHRKFRIVFT